MNVTCNDRDRIFEDGTSAEWAALEAHAASCPVCKEEVRAWKSLSVAAEELRDSSDSPSFWPRIERALAEETTKKAQRAGLRRWFSFLPEISLGRQTALAGALVLILTVPGGSSLHRLRCVEPNPDDLALLTSKALKEVDSAETTYDRAIANQPAVAKH